ncbi:EAL domain-containing protein [Actinotalea sp. M2MS4P-6]|uniref:putative bifunctional diguanylate cyclase/phosphodiesterase n=1 Tax=Actinotalea sp. M2MS4P-6 TaxID=2983762 RepID=UPI0021E4E184|nr:EAL domain-containing protein [Actinotalea sp. M2MS4P-6]MCV2393095.1 EAL domain-containing protein [Actinotalea sp. M2MS4P-6]
MQRAWAWYLAGAITLVLTDVLMPAGTPRDVLHVVVALSGPAAMVVGIRVNRPKAALAWWLLAAGVASWVLGDAGHAWLPGALGAAAHPVSDLLYLATYPLVMVALLRFARARTTRPDAIGLVDTAILMTGLGMVTWIAILRPAWLAAERHDVTTVIDLAWPVANILLFGALVHLAQSPGVGRRVTIGVAVVVGFGIGWDILDAALTGPAPAAHPVALDPRWLVGYPIAGVLALHPHMRRFSEPTDPRRRTTHVGALLYLFAALTVGPAIMLAQVVLGRPVAVVPVAVSSYALIGLLTVRLYVMIRRIDGQATTDELTGLPNRRALHAAAEALLTPNGDPHALLLLDLDRFKEVNDTLGHHAGDALLIEVTTRLRARLRSDDVLARLGGDEFAVLLDRAGVREAQHVARDLVTALEAPIELDDLAVRTAVSIGIALYPVHGDDLSTLLRRADLAMYRAKTRGPIALAGDEAGGQESLVTDLRLALAEHQLVLHYQPKVDLGSGHATGVEALVRWNHPARGLLYPDAFLPVVESAGLMHAMTRVVLTQALDQAARWRAAGRDLTVAVNLSPSTLVDADLPTEVSTLLGARDLPASALQLEITEEFLMADRARARSVLATLRESGVRIAVDDFGTGYSSLAYLRDLPIDELKLDRSFVRPMADDERAAALVSSTVALAHSLRLRMVAEGVEDSRALADLTEMGCDEAQGFYLSRPVPSDALERWLDDRDPRSRAAVT